MCIFFTYRAGVKCIDVLLNAGADLGIVDKDGNTALDAATAAERSDCISALEMERADKEVYWSESSVSSAVNTLEFVENFWG